MARRAGPTVQCSACRKYFYDIRSFDTHRSGHVNNRKCTNPENLGMKIGNTEVWKLTV